MKLILTVLLTACLSILSYGQNASDRDMVEQTCTDYINAFYTGDTSLINQSFKPSLHKLGYWQDDKSGKYGEPIYMTFEGAKKYANGVKEKKNFPSSEAPRKVEVLDVMSKIAAAKVTAWWGTDYILLSKTEDKWLIEQVIWQGPLQE